MPPDPEFPPPLEDPLPFDDEPLPELWLDCVVEVWSDEVWLGLGDAPPVDLDVCFGLGLEACLEGFLAVVDVVGVLCVAVLVVWLEVLVAAARVGVELDLDEPPQAARASAARVAASRAA